MNDKTLYSNPASNPSINWMLQIAMPLCCYLKKKKNLKKVLKRHNYHRFRIELILISENGQL